MEKIPIELTKESITWIEARIDCYAPISTAIESFGIYKGGNLLASLLHIARNGLCRGRKRMVVLPQKKKREPAWQEFFNSIDYQKLSFVLARWVQSSNKV